MIKLIATDMDGTLLDANHELTPSMRAKILELRHQGIKFGVATGRPMDSAVFGIPDIAELFDFAICDNGGFVYDFADGEIHEQFPLSEDLIREILDTFMPMGGNPVLTGPGKLYTEFEDFYNIEVRTHIDLEYVDVRSKVLDSHAKIIFSGEPETLARIEAHVLANPDPRYVAFYSQKELIEFMDPRINKMVGLQYYMDKYGITAKEIMTFGDNNNDLHMIEDAGHGVAMENATPAVKNVADAICGLNSEDGVKQYLDQYKF
ncbi:HAD family phosphatase [Erysipelothrix piscisicarius]|uniref:HAD family phosphatase n=1 Tax=Erysipelothrix piscisicarius TaxID=2485784 RepID=A0A3S8RP56_9FIRM|nr:HAD family hydrolase [Erysipelothrix piscisicarius]AZK44657.1 HAD family phosphatase [Erysipelothrix piscisicarius]